MAKQKFKQEITARFNLVAEELKKQGYATNTSIAKLIGQPLQVVSKLLSGERIITLEQVGFLTKSSNINATWLLTGQGEMIRTLTVEEPERKYYIKNKNGNRFVELPNGKYCIRVPLISAQAYAQYVREYTSSDFIETLENAEFHVDTVGRGNYVAFEIKGNSMDDGTISATPDGSMALCMELDQQHWQSKFRTNDYGWIIVHQDSILCKDIIGQDIEKGTILCHSRNPSPEYSDFEISLNNVKQIFKIIKRTF